MSEPKFETLSDHGLVRITFMVTSNIPGDNIEGCIISGDSYVSLTDIEEDSILISREIAAQLWPILKRFSENEHIEKVSL